MLIRTVRMTFRPDAVPAFLALFGATRDRIAAAPGCRSLALWRDARYPNVMTTFSHWDDEAALDAYRHSDLFRETWAETRPLFAAPPVAQSHLEVDVASQPSESRM